MSYQNLYSNCRCLTRAHKLFCVGLAVATLGAPGAVQAIELALTNIQPVDEQSIVGTDYDPTVDTATVWLEPLVLTPDPMVPVYRSNLDIDIRNDTNDWQRLDSLEVDYIGSGEPALSVIAANLVRYNSTYYTYPPSSDRKQRSAILSGGFGATGLNIQRNLIEGDLNHGVANDVETYSVDGYGTRVAVAAERRTLIGDPPEIPGDPFTLYETPVLALFDAGGSLLDTRDFSGQSIDLIEDLGDGRFLVAGKIDNSTIFVSRVLLYDFDAEGAAIDANVIQLDEGFSGDGILNISYAGCTVSAPVGLEATDTSEGMRYSVAAPLSCPEGRRAGITMTNSNGALASEFGTGGKLILAGPNNEGIEVAGLAPVDVDTDDRVAWLAATAGEGCYEGDSSNCVFALTRLTLDGQDEDLFWTAVDFDGGTNAGVNAIDIDIEGRPILAGSVVVDEMGKAALARFTSEGQLDLSFGVEDNGRSTFAIGAEGTVIHDIIVTADQNYWAAVHLAYDSGIDGIYYAFGVAAFDGDGDLGWHHNTQVSGEWEHKIVPTRLNYGSIVEKDVSGIAWALDEDSYGRVVVVGTVVSEHIDMFSDKWWAGPNTMAMARYLPNGEPESRRWLAPGATMELRVPEDRDFDPAPTQVSVKFDFMDGTLIDLQVDRDTQPLLANAVTSNPIPGGYLMPFRHTELQFNEAVSVGAHNLLHHHRHSESSRFAYDLAINRWNGFYWSGLKALGDPEQLDGSRSWNVPVIAMADGEVISCRRSAVDNEVGGREGKANFVKIQHAFDAVDKTEREYISYLHLKEESIPTDVCPLICPEDNEDCDPKFEGVDPDGREIPEAMRPSVTASGMIGRVGNTGNSGSPHLHIHLHTGAGGESGDPYQGAIPLLFQNVMIANRYDAMGDEINPIDWYEIDNLAIPHAFLAIPMP